MKSTLTLGEVVKARRLAMGMTMRRVADLAGLRDTTVMRLERDQFRTPSIRVVASLARVLELPVRTLTRAAGYEVDREIDLSDYLRARYPQLSDADLLVIDEMITKLAMRSLARSE